MLPGDCLAIRKKCQRCPYLLVPFQTIRNADSRGELEPVLCFPARCIEMSHMHREGAIPRFELAMLLLAIALSFAASQVTYAGDQDGVSGYKTKIYYQNGDGGANQSGYQVGNGTPLPSSTLDSSAVADERESIDLTAVILYLRGLLRFR